MNEATVADSDRKLGNEIICHCFLHEKKWWTSQEEMVDLLRSLFHWQMSHSCLMLLQASPVLIEVLLPEVV
ncbi:hypothetical protein DPMN_073435 [Dreissena polymorpha]|uniref:Uncharacterized protein n=1 Tax=Dreissena polymorpha TaxID=45954 RepID=A0A9D4HDD1_DREPO|nr:hypothetical protein DPMN_073435 [Dreissena polymorpha]